MTDTYSFDRMEGEQAVLVDDEGNALVLPLISLPGGTQPGDVIRRTESGWEVSPDETDARRQRAIALQQRLRRRQNDQ